MVCKAGLCYNRQSNSLLISVQCPAACILNTASSLDTLLASMPIPTTHNANFSLTSPPLCRKGGSPEQQRQFQSKPGSLFPSHASLPRQNPHKVRPDLCPCLSCREKPSTAASILHKAGSPAHFLPLYLQNPDSVGVHVNSALSILHVGPQELRLTLTQPAHLPHFLASFRASALSALLAQAYWKMSSSNML